MYHRRADHEFGDGIPEYHLDYCFPGDEDGNKLTMMVAIERHSKMETAMIVPVKGSTGKTPQGKCWTS